MATELFLQLHQLQEAYRSGAAEIQQLEAELERLKSTEAKYRQDASEYDESYTKLMLFVFPLVDSSQNASRKY
jgi:chromosome segregation ATPase